MRRTSRIARQAAALATLALAPVGCAQRESPSAEIVVSAAASLTDVMTELAAAYGATRPGVIVRNNFGASGTLEQQIRQGAEVELFVPAAARQMDALLADGLIEGASRRVLAGNELVLVAPVGAASSVGSLEALASPAVERIAIGEPGSVPAGEYARAALEHLGLWDEVRGKVVFTTNVRQALTYAERGEVDAALVYRTDALGSTGVRVVAAAPAGSYPPIVYPVALVSGAGEAAREYLDFLTGAEAAAVLRRHGFSPPPPAGD